MAFTAVFQFSQLNCFDDFALQRWRLLPC